MTTKTDQWLAEARAAGREAGRAAGSGAADANTSPAAIRKTLRMLEDGDPEAYDRLPQKPSLQGGEFADGPTARSVFCDVIGPEPDLEESKIVAEVAEAWEQGAQETFRDTCEGTLRGFLEES
jgi:hypothetical protein